MQLRKELLDLTDNENDDVLEITINNEIFNTPEKVHKHTRKSVLLNKLANTSTRTHTFKTPIKYTSTSKELLTRTVKQIFNETIQSRSLLSPIKKHQINMHTHINPSYQ